MKELKDILVDYDLAKELKEAGFPQDCFFRWEGIRNKEGVFEYERVCVGSNEFDCFNFIAAPTTDELLEQLPKDIRNSISMEYTIIGQYIVICNFIDEALNIDFSKIVYAEKLPNALAKMWLHIKKEGLIKEEDE